MASRGVMLCPTRFFAARGWALVVAVGPFQSRLGLLAGGVEVEGFCSRDFLFARLFVRAGCSNAVPRGTLLMQDERKYT